MQTDTAIVTISSFASGRDVAVGFISPATKQVRVLWVGESRLEHREIPAQLWVRVELEASTGHVPRRLQTASAIVRALFDDDRRACTKTELISRFPMVREQNASLMDGIDDMLCMVALDMRIAPSAPLKLPDGISPSIL
jgi:hypothetical protein